MKRSLLSIPLLVTGLVAACADPAPTAPAPAGRYAAIDRLPDFAGDWVAAKRRAPPQPAAGEASSPGGTQSDAPEPVWSAPAPPLTAAALKELERRRELAAQGKVYGHAGACLPSGGARFWSGPHPKEIVMSPERIFVWSGTTDGVSYRRIYIDGREHDPAADPTYLGDSVGKWEGDTLVVDTTNFLDSVPIAGDIDAFVANGGGMHVVERWRLVAPDMLQVVLQVEAPNVLTKRWNLTLTFDRVRGREYEMREAVCAQNTADGVDSQGFQTFDTKPPADIKLPPGMVLK